MTAEAGGSNVDRMESLKKRGVEDFFPLPRASQLEFRRRAEWGLRIPLSYLDTSV